MQVYHKITVFSKYNAFTPDKSENWFQFYPHGIASTLQWIAATLTQIVINTPCTAPLAKDRCFGSNHCRCCSFLCHYKRSLSLSLSRLCNQHRWYFVCDAQTFPLLCFIFDHVFVSVPASQEPEIRALFHQVNLFL